MKFYIDADYRCHASDPDGIYRAVAHPFFDGKCPAFIEGYCYDDSKGTIHIYPWKSLAELEEKQFQYERDLIANSIPTADLEAAYREGVNSAYD